MFHNLINHIKRITHQLRCFWKWFLHCITIALKAKEITSQFRLAIQNRHDCYAIQSRKNGHPRPVHIIFLKCLGFQIAESFIPWFKHGVKWYCRILWQKFSEVEKGFKHLVGWVERCASSNEMKIGTQSWWCSRVLLYQSLCYIYNTLHTHLN